MPDYSHVLMKTKLFILISTLLSFYISSAAQHSVHHSLVKSAPPDSVDIAYYSKKNWKIATGQIVGLNMGIWAINRYIDKQDFAYIDLNTIEANLKKGFVWDNDQMATNMFGHPYHGNLYYNAARSNGYSFWESGAFALGGSAMWELFLENEYPSINDIIATPVGGLAIGEVLFTTSDLILDDRTTGSERVGREVAAFIVAPTRGLTRIITGDAWKKRRTSGRQYGIPEIKIGISSGIRTLTLRNDSWSKDIIWTTNINIEYGDRFDTEKKIPYDYFTLSASLNAHSSQPILGKFNLTARLHGAELMDNEKDYLNIGLYQHFLYYDSDTISSGSGRIPYRFSSPASFGGGLIYKSKRSKLWSFDAYAHLNAILLGATLSDHYKVDMRNYNMGSGFGWHAGFNLGYKTILKLSGRYEAYHIFTWEGYPAGINWETVEPKQFSVQGDKSQAMLHAISIRADIKLLKEMYFTAMYYLYSRNTHYSQYKDIKIHAEEGAVMLTYKF